MEPRYTEAEWRAFSVLEELASSFWWSTPLIHHRVRGPSFDPHGQFVLAARCYKFPRCGMGPPGAVMWHCMELSSEAVAGAASTMQEALDEARANLSAVHPDLWQRLVEEGRESISRRKADAAKDREAAKVSAERKAAKLGKRAKAVFAASNGSCHYCGCALDIGGKWHIEHKMPRALKGGSEMHNLVAACVPCNMRKRDKTDLEFQALLATESALTQAAQGSVESADPTRFDSLNSHGLKHGCASLATPLN